MRLQVADHFLVLLSWYLTNVGNLSLLRLRVVYHDGWIVVLERTVEESFCDLHDAFRVNIDGKMFFRDGDGDEGSDSIFHFAPIL